MRFAAHLDADAGTGRVPAPTGLFHIGGNVARLRPGFAAVGTANDQHVDIVAGKRQPNGCGRIVDYGAWVADGDGSRAPFFIDEFERPPCFSAVAAAFEHQIDIAVVVAIVFASLAKREQRFVRRDDDRRDAVRMISLPTRHKDVGSLNVALGRSNNSQVSQQQAYTTVTRQMAVFMAQLSVDFLYPDASNANVAVVNSRRDTVESTRPEGASSPPSKRGVGHQSTAARPYSMRPSQVSSHNTSRPIETAATAPSSKVDPLHPDALNLPNLITVSRLVLALVLFILIYIHGHWVLAAGVFLVAAATDALDGYLARKYGTVTALGRILDPFADKIIICGAFIFLLDKKIKTDTGELWSGVNAWMVIIVVGREMFVTSLRGFLEQQGKDFSASLSGKLKMVLQCVAVMASLLSLDGSLATPAFAVVRNILLWLAVVVTVWSGLIYAVRAVNMLRGGSKGA